MPYESIKHFQLFFSFEKMKITMLFATTSNFKSIFQISIPSVMMNCIHYSLLEVDVNLLLVTSNSFKYRISMITSSQLMLLS